MAIIGSLPNNLTNGTTADATQVMANFNTIVNAVNNATTGAASIPNVQSAIYNYAADTGSVNAIIITPTAPPAALTDGMQFRGKVANTNTSQTVTLAVGSTAAAGVVIDQAGTLPAIGSMISGMFYTWTWSAGLSKWVLQNPSHATSSFTSTIVGGPTNPVVTSVVMPDADDAYFRFPGFTGTGTGTSFTMTCPANLLPANLQVSGPIYSEDVSALVVAFLQISITSPLTFVQATNVTISGAWTAGSTRGVNRAGQSVRYKILS